MHHAAVRFLFVLGLATLALSTAPAESAQKIIEIAAQISQTGEATAFGTGSLEGVKLALEEANANREGLRFELKVYDDQSTTERAQEVARRVVASPAVVAVGPSSTRTSLAAGPVFAAAGMASITTTATADTITDNATTFRVMFKNSDQGELLATYLYRVLAQRKVVVIVADRPYGRTLEQGFRSAAARLGLEAEYHSLKIEGDVVQAVSAMVPGIGSLPVVLAMLDQEGALVLPILRRQGVKGPFLGGDAFGVEAFNALFAAMPEEKAQPGFFTEGVYGFTPMLLDSANAEILSFAERYRTRFGHDPGWVAVSGYEAARFAVEAIRAVHDKAAEPAAMRAAVLQYLLGMKDTARAPMGLLGPLAFDANRGREMAVRIGRFNRGHLESAPLQIVSVANPVPAEVESGAVFELRPGRYGRLQQVIYSGIFLNEIMWVDQTHFTFGADLYVWIRFAKNSWPGAADPAEIKFPELASGHFDREHPVESRELPDGTRYRLWRVQGEFRNNFDLRRYPFDRERLNVRFFNARAPVDQIVYALDKRASVGAVEDACEACAGVSRDAFRSLSQWRFIEARQQRENFVARSSLGDPYRLGRVDYRELSGYSASVVLARRSFTTLMKNLFPLLLMTCIMYASLHFPPILVQPKVAVAITGVLTGMVLLNLVNSQLGAIGYTVAVEYAFYVYFGLGLLTIVSVLTGEHLRAIERTGAAERWDFWTRIIFLGAVLWLVVMAVVFHRGGVA